MKECLAIRQPTQRQTNSSKETTAEMRTVFKKRMQKSPLSTPQPRWRGVLSQEPPSQQQTPLDYWWIFIRLQQRENSVFCPRGSLLLFYFILCFFFLYQLCPALKQHENFVGSVLLARNPVTFMDPEGNWDLTNAMGLNQCDRPGVGFSPAQNSSGSSASGPSAPPQSWSVLIWTTQSSFHPDICS